MCDLFTFAFSIELLFPKAMPAAKRCDHYHRIVPPTDSDMRIPLAPILTPSSFAVKLVLIFCRATSSTPVP